PSFVCVRSIDFNSFFFFYSSVHLRFLHSFPTRRSSDLVGRCSQGLFAFSDSCTHKGGPLSDGALVGCTVQCPWHGSQFDVSSGRDRKSTRLNSSHVAISYAVFCVKQKSSTKIAAPCHRR